MMNPLLSPAPGFDQPLQLLSACHGRMIGMTDTLAKLPQYIAQHGVNDDVVLASTRVLKYFDTAGQHHHEDEEQDVFPLLRAAAAAQGNLEIPALLDELLAQHIGMNAAWQTLRPHLCLLAEKQSVPESAYLAMQGFIDAYLRHIPLEEEKLLPYAATALDTNQLATIGKAMAARRGV